MPEPSQDSLPAAIAAEQPGIERKWRLGNKTALALFQTAQRVLQFTVGRSVMI